ncbi:hypothetical protein E2C01_009161 [Portunus trituberculatus]|uniref:Uncharacterized protein n=1 Tax=Portunus trituberculatus TaxID=210409 RepID=A0A5B7D456_PORTR|nr:hypothetical protein [Portunus trituberculatus]
MKQEYEEIKQRKDTNETRLNKTDTLTASPLHTVSSSQAPEEGIQKTHNFHSKTPSQTQLPVLNEDISRATPGHLTTAGGRVWW